MRWWVRAQWMGSWRLAGIVLPSQMAATGQKRSSSWLAVYWFPEELNVSKQDWNEGGKWNGMHLDWQCYAQNSWASPHQSWTWRCHKCSGHHQPWWRSWEPVNNTKPVAVGILPVGIDFGEEGHPRHSSCISGSCCSPWVCPTLTPKSTTSLASLTSRGTSTRWMGNNEWEMDVCNDKGAHFCPGTQGQWARCCSGQQSLWETLSTHNEGEWQVPLTLVQISWIHGGRKRFTRGGSKKAQVTHRWGWVGEGWENAKRGSF